jgi:SAM-dependent methyltransferase
MMKLHEPSVASPAAVDPWRRWLDGVTGHYLLQWESEQLDRTIVDWFGYHAVQLGMGNLNGLRASRISTHTLVEAGLGHEPQGDLIVEGFESLPFADESVDLVIVPHALEFASDPHEVLREVVRVLRPEGRVVITGLNPISMWRMQQAGARMIGRAVLPREGRWMAMPRVRDWLRLLGCELDGVDYGCYRPLCQSDTWLERTRFLETPGDRWWPILGAVYMVYAVKRVVPLRLIGPAWRSRQRALKGHWKPATHREGSTSSRSRPPQT